MQPTLTTSAEPDFRHIRAWIFDLDNTLYRADSDLFAQIDIRMQAYVQRFLKVGPEEARRIQKAYYRDHGTTLTGLIKLHDADPEEFLLDVHDIDLAAITADQALAGAIEALPGKRFVFTNGCRHHAERVLARTGLTEFFEEIWDIRTIRFSPKPLREAYDRILTHSGVAPREAAMFEDIARNLVPAHALGMTTVWVKNESQWSKQGPEFPVAGPENIDYETQDLAHFLKTIRTAS
ncbi:MAG TPA: pyrimidine 5'-nucleotidase [Rhizomicrobium sp.]|jgi:putative hydrolase of the HAD superfamily